MSNTKVAFLAPLVAIIAISSFLFAPAVKAAYVTFIRISTTSIVGTSTQAVLTPGTGTTTLVYDAYAIGGTGELDGPFAFFFNTQFTGSSTASILCRAYYASNDGVDYYRFSATSTFSSTSGTAADCFSFSSSTAGITGPVGVNNVVTQLPIMARYTKIVFYTPIGALNGMMWAETIGAKERF